jgi:hypothetical protein
MWIKLLQPLAVFFPGETLRAGTVVSIGGPKGRKLVGQGKAIQHVFPAGDPDDVEGMRNRCRKANGPLWDDDRRPVAPATSPEATVRHDAAFNLSARVQQLLGPRSAKHHREMEARRAAQPAMNRGASKTFAR